MQDKQCRGTGVPTAASRDSSNSHPNLHAHRHTPTHSPRCLSSPSGLGHTLLGLLPSKGPASAQPVSSSARLQKPAQALCMAHRPLPPLVLHAKPCAAPVPTPPPSGCTFLNSRTRLTKALPLQGRPHPPLGPHHPSGQPVWAAPVAANKAAAAGKGLTWTPQLSQAQQTELLRGRESGARLKRLAGGPAEGTEVNTDPPMRASRPQLLPLNPRAGPSTRGSTAPRRVTSSDGAQVACFPTLQLWTKDYKDAQARKWTVTDRRRAGEIKGSE